MYRDLIVFVALCIIVIMFFKNFSSFVYFLGIFEILLRILTFIKENIGLPDVAALIGKYVPENIPAILSKYATGVANTVLQWVFVILMIVFETYLIKYFLKKRKF